MNAVGMLADALIVAGALGLVHGSFTYARDTHKTRLEPIALVVIDRETVDVPSRAGVGSILLGGLLLLVGDRKI